MWLQRCNTVVFVKLLNRIIVNWIFQIPEDTSLGGTNLHTGGFKAASDPVIAQRAFLRGFGYRI